MLKLLEDWAENYLKVLKSDGETEGVASALGAYKVTEAYVHALPKMQQKVLRMRYLEGGSWDGIGRLCGMDATWAKWKAAQGMVNLEQLFDLEKRVKNPEKTSRSHERTE